MNKNKPSNLGEIFDYEDFQTVLESRFSVYSKCVIQDRAIPDVRDGLKPVQRRILYSMYLDHNTFKNPYKKSAKAVGLILGNFHPHGDSSVYDAMVRLSQDWKINYPLIDMQGNNGSIDDDPAAAMRYTEAKLSAISDLLLLDIDSDTVDAIYNFDDTELEPTVLPAAIPNLLLNGAKGIAIGYATEIPPHNLQELVNAIEYRIKNPHSDLGEILSFIKGPDFPTGGIISKEGLIEAYTTGKGKISVRSKVTIDDNKIVITEIPYDIIKSDLVLRLKEVQLKKEGSSIEDVSDLTDRNGIKIVITLKKNSNIDAILSYLYKTTPLQVNYNYNMVVIKDRKPLLAPLLTLIDAYIEHLKEVALRKAKFDLDKANKRIHILEGLEIAILNIDEVIKIIRAALNKSEAKLNLMSRFALSENQAEAIVMLQLYRLTNTDYLVLENEKNELLTNIGIYNKILSDKAYLTKHLIKQLINNCAPFYKKRATEIVDFFISASVDKVDLILKEEVMISVTKDGYLKKCSLRSFSSSTVNGHKNGDIVLGYTLANSTDTLLLFTSGGYYLSIPVYALAEKKWKEEGEHVNNIIKISGNEKIVSAILVRSFKDGIYIITASNYGFVKKTPLTEFKIAKMDRPSTCMNLKKGDKIVSAYYTDGDSDLIFTSDNGKNCYIVKYNENLVPSIGLRGQGVKAINIADYGELVSLLVNTHRPLSKIVTISAKGGIRIIDESKIKTITRRLNTSEKLYKTFNNNPHRAIVSYFIDDRSDFVITVITENIEEINVDLGEQKSERLDIILSKPNIIIASQIILTSNNFIPIITDDTKIYESSIVKNIKTEDTDDTETYPMEDYFE